jgi:hypothetical protein
MKNYNALLASDYENSNTSKKIAENTNCHTTKEKLPVASNVHAPECCVNYEPLDTTLKQENL